MTEEQKLKQQAQTQFLQERLDEVNKYLDEHLRDLRKASKIFFVFGAASLVFSVLFFVVVHLPIIEVLWLASLSVQWAFLFPRCRFLSGEIDGCIDTLRMLHLMSEENDPRSGRKLKMKKKSWYERAWRAVQSKMQRKAYGEENPVTA